MHINFYQVKRSLVKLKGHFFFNRLEIFNLFNLKGTLIYLIDYFNRLSTPLPSIGEARAITRTSQDCCEGVDINRSTAVLVSADLI